MARPSIVRGTYINVLMGNGAGPEVFSPLCGVRSKSLDQVIETSDDYIRDCADPTDVPTRSIVATGEHWDLPYSGVLNRAQLADMQAAVGQYKNYRFEIAQPAGDAVYGGYYAGRAMMTRLRIVGDDGTNAQIEGTILSDGPWVFTVVP
jgi:hypothetical protein